jgi:hypothetical protein
MIKTTKKGKREKKFCWALSYCEENQIGRMISRARLDACKMSGSSEQAASLGIYKEPGVTAIPKT